MGVRAIVLDLGWVSQGGVDRLQHREKVEPTDSGCAKEGALRGQGGRWWLNLQKGVHWRSRTEGSPTWEMLRLWHYER